MPLAGVRAKVITASPLLKHAVSAAVTSLGGGLAADDESVDVILIDWREDHSAEAITALKAKARAVIALVAQEERGAIERSRATGRCALHFKAAAAAFLG
ncbi:MAG: hypothetical protein WDM79_01210 [Terricaulis sp.]